MQSISQLVERAVAQINAAATAAALDQVRVQYLGRSGELTSQLKTLGGLPPAERKSFGQIVNAAKGKLEEAIEQQGIRIGSNTTIKMSLTGGVKIGSSAATDQSLTGGVKIGAGPALDVTLPGRRRFAGRPHPMTVTAEAMKRILMGLGFSYADFPDIETEHYNFDVLNTPAWHPARDMHDTFYIDGQHLMRTHTTAFQGRVMKASGGRVPIRAMTTGRCYRKDDIDASHFPIFQQLDVFAVGTKLSMSDLRWTLTELAQGLFGGEAKLRFRPSYFPFTTPSAEVDVSCVICRQKGCSLCSRTGWIEVLGSGMMRPEVLREGGLDPAKHQGFAFGIGVDRITMLRHQINDIRHLYQNEEAFLRQF